MLLHGSKFDIKRYVAEHKVPAGVAISAGTVSSTAAAAVAGTSSTPATRVDTTHTGTVARKSSQTLFQIVPMTVVCGQKRINTFGMLDSGSQSTFIRSDLAQKLALR